MAKRLTDANKKKIIADYVQCENYAEVGRRWGISGNHVKNIVRAAPDIADKFIHKKEENTLDVLAYLDSKTASLKRLGDYILDERLNPEKARDHLDKIPIRDLVMAYGTLTDKSLKSRELSAKVDPDRGKGDANRIVNAMADLADIIRAPVPDREIPEDE